HQRAAPLPCPRAYNGVDRHRDRLDKGGMLHRQTARKGVDDVLGDGDELGERAMAAVLSTRDAEDLSVVAEVHLPPAAEGARAAVDGGVEGHPVAGGKTGDGAADALDDTGRFVAHDERGNAAAGGAVVT